MREGIKNGNIDDLEKCENCGARYNASLSFFRGHYRGTSSEFVPSYKVPDDSCPVCETKREES